MHTCTLPYFKKVSKKNKSKQQKLDQTSVFKEWNINSASTEANEGKNA